MSSEKSKYYMPGWYQCTKCSYVSSNKRAAEACCSSLKKGDKEDRHTAK